MRTPGNASLASAGVAACLLTGTMLLGWGASLPTTAVAANGSITISQRHNADATYDAYRIAKATISRDGKAKAATWESDATRDAVLTVLDSSENGASQPYSAWLVSKGIVTQDDVTDGTDAYRAEKARAMNAMDYVSEMISSSPDAGTGDEPDAKANSSFASKLADGIAGPSVNPTGTAKTGIAYSGEPGYYLFMTTPSTLSDGDAKTRPIWTPIIDGVASAMQEKSYAPTISQTVKVVREAGDPTTVVDAGNGDDVEYRTKVTLPEDYGGYSEYPIAIKNTIEPGVDVPDGGNGIKVIIDGVDVTGDPHVTVTVDADGNPSVTIDDLGLVDLGKGHGPIGKDSEIMLVVPGKVTGDAGIGPANGTDNVPTLAYPTDDPDSGDTSTMEGNGTSVVTYRIDVSKVDEETRRALAGAKFYVRTGDALIKTDGSRVTYSGIMTEDALSSAGLLFESDASGEIPIPRIDEGTYAMTELVAPEGYDPVVTPLTMTIGATKDAGLIKVTGIDFSASGWKGLSAPDPATKVVTEEQDGICRYSVSDGTFVVRISNKKEITLPVTGLHPRQLTTIVGAMILLVSLIVWIRNRKQDEDMRDGTKERP